MLVGRFSDLLDGVAGLGPTSVSESTWGQVMLAPSILEAKCLKALSFFFAIFKKTSKVECKGNFGGTF